MSNATINTSTTVTVPKTNIRRAINILINRIKNAMPSAEVTPEDLEQRAKIEALKAQIHISFMNIR